jgi:hypothetical protein
MCRGSTRVHVHRLDFQYNNFYMSFLLSKNGLCMRISAYPLAENDFFLNVSHLLWVWDFGGMYLTHLETRIWRGTFHIYFKKWFFWPSKLCCTLGCMGKKYFLSTLNIMILQTMRNECERFGRHVDIEVSYKILRLDVLKDLMVRCTKRYFDFAQSIWV